MKKLLLTLILFAFWACPSDDVYTRNPYIQQTNFSYDINMNLPTYSNLQFASNYVIIDHIGVNGVIVFNTGSGYVAYERSCANHNLQSCSVLTLSGLEATCQCTDAIRYSIFTGQIIAGTGDYGLVPYHVQQSGDVLRVSN
jgi:nitrite reductase/ring-hydroxylating ferredoxin subunit